MDRATTLNLTVSEVLTIRPGAARVFIERRMGCIGCAFSPFETIAEVARAYGMNCDDLAAALASAGDTSEGVHR